MRSIVQIKKDMKHVMELSRFLELYGQASDECTFSQKTLDWRCEIATISSSAATNW
jgi:hypothetical protein